jgi:hypothetical protein
MWEIEMNDEYRLFQELTELRVDAASVISDLIALAHDLYPDEPEMYEFNERLDRAHALLKRLNGDRDES